jgi:hypothetical protein
VGFYGEGVVLKDSVDDIYLLIEYNQELNIIHNILQNNAFPIKPHKPPTPNSTQPKDTHTPTKWAKFTYIGRETSYIKNIFRKPDLKIAFHTSNTIEKLLTCRTQNQDTYKQSGAYKLTCPDCNKAYIGHTG